MMAGGGIGRPNSVGDDLYGLSSDTWKTGWIFMVAGRSNLYAVSEITLVMTYGLANQGINFLVG